MASHIEIRPYTVADRDGLISLFRQSVRQIACRDYSEIQVAVWAPDEIDAEAFGEKRLKTQTLVVTIDDELAGFTDVSPEGLVDMLYVHPNYQRRGVARVLLEAVETIARRQGLNRLHTEASITAKPVFKRHGFQVLSEQTVTRCGQEFRNYRMEKILT